MRLFAGIALDDRTRAHCVDIQERLRRASFEARYEAPEKLHITLAFLGNVPVERRDEVASVLDEVAAKTPAFDLVLDRLAAFPNARRPRILYVGSWKQGSPFVSLAATLRERYERLGFAFAGDAVAHVTIGRVKGGSNRPLPVLDIKGHRFHVSHVTLFESIPSEDTTRYEARRVSPLA